MNSLTVYKRRLLWAIRSIHSKSLDNTLGDCGKVVDEAGYERARQEILNIVRRVK